MEEEECIQGLMGTPEIKRLLAKPRCRWEDIIKMDHREIKRGMDRFYLAQGRPVENCN
jgi:hypothetical protein